MSDINLADAKARLGELVDRLQPGDTIAITGVARLLPGSFRPTVPDGGSFERSLCGIWAFRR